MGVTPASFRPIHRSQRGFGKRQGQIQTFNISDADCSLSCVAGLVTLNENGAMSVQEIEEAVKNLSREDLGAFRKWFWDFDQYAWDKEIEEDVAAGRFDSIIREVDKDIREGRLTDIP